MIRSRVSFMYSINTEHAKAYAIAVIAIYLQAFVLIVLCNTFRLQRPVKVATIATLQR